MNVTRLVRQALKDNPQARNSDRVLLIQVWHTLGLNLTPDQIRKFLDIPSAETIRRVRQKLQENGEYVATGNIKQARDHKSYVIQQNAPSAKPERLETLMQETLI
jgi:hypothetical protein